MSTSPSRKSRDARIFAAATATAALALTTASATTASADENAPPVRMTTSVSAMAEPCQEGWLCIWDETAGHGTRVDFYECAWQDVRDYGLSRVSSFVNNQYDDTVSTFKGPDISEPEGPWYRQYTSTAFEIREDTTDFLTYGVQVC